MTLLNRTPCFQVSAPVQRKVNESPWHRRSGAAALDIRASVGTSTSPTSTGTKAVTGVGFQPKVVMPFGVFANTDGSGGDVPLNIGAMTASQQASVSVYSVTGVTTSNTSRGHSGSHSIYAVNVPGVIYQQASRQSLDANGFTLNHTIVQGTARILNNICLGGADLEVSLTQHQMNATNAPQSFAHGLSGAPTGLLLFGAVNWNVPTHTLADAYLSIGSWSSSGQFCAQIMSRNGLTTSSTVRQLVNNSVMGWIYPGVASPSRRQLAVASVDSVNVNTTYPVTVDSGQIYFWMLAIRGAKCQTGTFDHNGSLSPLTINTPSITPKLFLPVFVPDAVDFINTVRSYVQLGIGATDGINNVSCGITDADLVTTTNARRWQSSNKLSEYSSGGVLAYEATASFSGESVVVSPTVLANSGYGQGAYMVIGA